MQPVLTPAEMTVVDSEAADPTEVLIERAGFAVAVAGADLMGGTYGRRVVVVAGRGNNGADGRVAARVLCRWGARVEVIDAANEPKSVPFCDLLIDAAYGTGFRGEYRSPHPGAAAVLAVDIPSGVDGLTGRAGDGAVWADATVTFAALKPGLLLGEGPDRSGAVHVADIGLDVARAGCHLVDDADASAWLPTRPRSAHKWQSAVLVAAGSSGMSGAAHLVSAAALRAGAGYVRLAVPGEAAPGGPIEAVAAAVPAEGWHRAVLEGAERFGCLAVGPGLGRSESTAADVRAVVRDAPVPVVVDADGLNVLGSASDAAGIIRHRKGPTLLTPHDGEFERLAGHPPGDDRIAAAAGLAQATGATVLLKGSTTVVAGPSGEVLLSASGSTRLATAGTGDVLTGVCAALMAQGLDPMRAAAIGAHLHGRAAGLGPAHGLVAGDLIDLLPSAWEEMARG